MIRVDFLRSVGAAFVAALTGRKLDESHVESHVEPHDTEYAGEWWLDHLLLSAHLDGREITAVVGDHAFWLEFQERFPPKWEAEQLAIPTVTMYYAPTGEIRMLKSWQFPELPLNEFGVALIETLPPSWDGYPYV
jgi:hypothetical protein